MMTATLGGWLSITPGTRRGELDSGWGSGGKVPEKASERSGRFEAHATVHTGYAPELDQRDDPVESGSKLHSCRER